MRIRVMIARPIPRYAFEELKKEKNRIKNPNADDANCDRCKKGCKDEHDALRAQILLKDAEIAELRKQVAELKTKVADTVGSYEETLTDYQEKYNLAKKMCAHIKHYVAEFEDGEG